MIAPKVIAAAAEVEKFCAAQGWRFCFIGGVAVQRWGNPRYTQDVDLTLLTGFGSEEKFIDAFLTAFPGREPNSGKFAIRSRVLLATTRSGVDVDVSLGAMPFEEASVQRASRWKTTKKLTITTCSAEDLLVYKVFASRSQDWADVENILICQHGKLNFAQIEKDVRPLLELKEDDESFPRFEQLIKMVDRRLNA